VSELGTENPAKKRPSGPCSLSLLLTQTRLALG
ncbi:MAG: hypothetical protein ACJAR0_004427, partial [Candidatus Azotimanducaceae bacterium]